jgi:hypothetical protein
LPTAPERSPAGSLPEGRADFARKRPSWEPRKGNVHDVIARFRYYLDWIYQGEYHAETEEDAEEKRGQPLDDQGNGYIEVSKDTEERYR